MVTCKEINISALQTFFYKKKGTEDSFHFVFPNVPNTIMKNCRQSLQTRQK